MSKDKRHYLSYLLRLWKVKLNGEESWRASLEDPHSGEQNGFANLEALTKFLLRQTQDGGEGKQAIQILERGENR